MSAYTQLPDCPIQSRRSRIWWPAALRAGHESGTIGSRIQAGLEVTASSANGRSRDLYYSPNPTRCSPDWGFGEKL